MPDRPRSPLDDAIEIATLRLLGAKTTRDRIEAWDVLTALVERREAERALEVKEALRERVH